MHLARLSSRLAFLALVIFTSGCALFTPPTAKHTKPKTKPPEPQPPVQKSYWNAETASGDPSILINLTQQRAHFFRNEKEVGQSLISSGKRGFETATGSFNVVQLDKNHVSNLYGDFVNANGGVVHSNADTSKQKTPSGAKFRGAKMPFFVRFNGGIGMHAGKLPGYPASHGCVRMPRLMAEHFFENAVIGMPVIVTGSAPTRPAEKTSSRPTRIKSDNEPAKAKPAEPAGEKPSDEKKPDSEPGKAAEPDSKPEPKPETKPEPTPPAPDSAGS